MAADVGWIGGDRHIIGAVEGVIIAHAQMIAKANINSVIAPFDKLPHP